MAVSFSREDLRQLLTDWLDGSTDISSDDGVSGIQQAELMMAVMPIDCAAQCVLEFVTQRRLYDSQDRGAPVDEDESRLSEPAEVNLLSVGRKGQQVLSFQKGDQLLAAWARSASILVKRTRSELTAEDLDAGQGSPAWNRAEVLQQVSSLYQACAADGLARCHVLTWLAWQAEDGLQLLVQEVVSRPPQNADGIGLFFAPLLKREELPVSALFPALLGGVSELALATAIIDLSNFLYRNRACRPHPAAVRALPLAQLLAGATQRLLQIEQSPAKFGLPAEKLSQVINDTVGLVTAICDAMAQIGDKAMVGKIFPCLDVKHRRVQLESATALATLGEEDGKKRLIALAAEPLVRQRVIAYATELGIEQEISAEFKTTASAAEAELALWLAHPQQIGFAPYDVSLIDQRQQFWPGFDQPVDCFLMGYSYPFEGNAYHNVGLVGPITHSFSTSLINLPVEDVYAVFAGWQVKHPDIYAVGMDDLSPHQIGTVARLKRRMTDESLTVLDDRLLGHCVGHWALVCRVEKEDREGWAVADQEQCIFLPNDSGFAQFDASLAWYLFLGRQLLLNFNQ